MKLKGDYLQDLAELHLGRIFAAVFFSLISPEIIVVYLKYLLYLCTRFKNSTLMKVHGREKDVALLEQLYARKSLPSRNWACLFEYPNHRDLC